MTTNSDGPENAGDDVDAQTTSVHSPRSGEGDETPDTLTGERSRSAETGSETLLPTPEPTDGGAPAP